MFYTYVLESIKSPDKKYIGHTTDLRQRLAAHNAGKCKYTAGLRPWKIKAYFAFDEFEIAKRFFGANPKRMCGA